MVTNLFSIFDPHGLAGLNGWVGLRVILLARPINKYLLTYGLITPLKALTQLIKQEVDTPLIAGVYSNKAKGLIGLFLFIITINRLGLVPYVFTPTAHILIPLSLAVPIWLGLYRYGWCLTPNQIFTHLVPTGTPPILIPFIVLIETISALIRPITLSIRLIANIVAGHLLLSLAGGAVTSVLSFIPIFSAQLILILLEMAVALIQGYVFIILITLYVKEVFV